MSEDVKNPAPSTNILPEHEFQMLLSNMRREYGRLLPVKVAELESEWEMLVEEWEAERLKRFVRLAHSLAGSAGSYGYSRVGENARALELFVKGTLSDEPPTREETCAVTTLMTALHIDNEVSERDTAAHERAEIPMADAEPACEQAAPD